MFLSRRFLLCNTLRRAGRGFTLVELAIVIAILGILAAVALSNLGSTTAAAECSVIKDMNARLNSAVAQYLASSGEVPRTFAAFVITDSNTFPAANPSASPPFYPLISVYGFGTQANKPGKEPCNTTGGSLNCHTSFSYYQPQYWIDQSSGHVTANAWPNPGQPVCEGATSDPPPGP